MNDTCRNLLLCASISVALGACGNLAGRSDIRQTFYDLGPSQQHATAAAAIPARIEVRAPSWLSNATMQYRLDYQQPAPRMAFSESRWASPPAEMLERKLARALTADSPAAAGEHVTRNGCRLRIELDEFSQVFDTPQSSHATIVARAELLPPRGDAAIARHLVTLREATPSPDAKGGVVGHQRASDRLTRELGTWLSAQNTGTVRPCTP
jgi:cholesterol transport system auxiliary component